MSQAADKFVELAVLERFDRFLAERSLVFRGLIVGGTAWSLLGIRDELTHDVDLIEAIPDEVRSASREFAKLEGLHSNWLSDRAIVVTNYLTFGYGVNGTQELFSGRALTLVCPSVENLLISKLCAVVDRPGNEQDVIDIMRLGVDVSVFDRGVAHMLKKVKADKEDFVQATRVYGLIRKRLFGI